MREVLISVQPMWCKLIANGKKTVEVRKTRPKIETPFKVYIYMTNTKGQVLHLLDNPTPYWETLHLGKGKVIGEFVCRNIYDIECSSDDHNHFSENGTCLTVDEIRAYCNGETLYGWEISDLKIYDNPKELGEFVTHCKYEFTDDFRHCEDCQHYYYSNTPSCGTEEYCGCDGLKPITRPPQSWCYVEGGDES